MYYYLGGVNNLHGVPGLLSALASGVVAAFASRELYGSDEFYKMYPARIPAFNSSDYTTHQLNATDFKAGGPGRTGMQQAGFQLAALATTLGMAIVGGLLTGVVMRLPLFEQITDDDQLFDDEPNWHTTGHEDDFEISEMHKTTAEKKMFLTTSA